MKDNTLSINISTGTILKAMVLVLGLVLFVFLFDVFLIILTSVVIASAVEPTTKWFAKKRVPRVLAVLFIYVLFFSIIIGSLYFLIPPLLTEMFDLSKTAPEKLESFDFFGLAEESWASLTGTLGIDFPLENLFEGLKKELEVLAGGAFLTTAMFFGGIFNFVLILVLSFYLAVQEKGIENFLRLTTPLKYEEYILSLWRRAQKKIGLWMKGQLILSLIVGVLVFLGLTILGVRYALTLAIIAAIFELIPIFGPILSAVPAFFIALTSGFPLALAVIALYVIIQQFENHLIYPIAVKKVVGVHPIIAILSLIIGWKLAGFLGIILAVPVATVLLELANDYGEQKLAWLKKISSKSEK
ncbi:MAG TPA: AI-2E family transporter [Candidatus Vogelbacteria bacterium]|nr:AI-2E family transporter [Candidatus Vogelbacteria bacterium]